MATLHAVRSQWHGRPQALVDALEGSSTWPMSAAGGLAVGRSWPSGLSLWLGAEGDRYTQSYRHTERHEELRHDLVVAQIVTLNTQVVFTDVDTITTVVMRESTAEGADDRIRIRVPIECGWARALGRWSLGVRIGAQFEHTFARSTGSLVIDEAAGLIRSRQLDRKELRARYPSMLSIVSGLSASYSITERLTFATVPFIALPATTIGRRGDVWTEPQRMGLRFQLLHRF